jgi:Putative MetA-pathway of phenol degradation
MKKFYLLLAALFPLVATAQTLTDGFMMPKNDLCTGFMFTHDQWTKYWEGPLKRDNDNIGKVTTQTITWVGVYGLSDKFNVVVMVPYVKTKASKGTLTGMEGIQDLSLGVKYNFFTYESGSLKFKTFAGANFTTPLSNYTADFLPLSIGMESKKFSLRVGSYLRHKTGLFFNANVGYTYRTNVTIDRPAYYTGNELYLTNEVWMPNVFDLVAGFGYAKGPLQVHIDYMQQNTLGGADIRRQDMPFVSNRMNYSKVGLDIQYFLPQPKGLAVKGMFSTTSAGRNVGQSTTVTLGLLYTIHFSNEEKPLAQ